MFCPNCGKTNRNSATFCGSCGQSLQRSHTSHPDEPNSEVCHSCGANLKSNSRFCGKCGAGSKEPDKTLKLKPAGEIPSSNSSQTSKYKSYFLVGALVLAATTTGSFYLIAKSSQAGEGPLKAPNSETKTEKTETRSSTDTRTATNTTSTPRTTETSARSDANIATKPTVDQIKNDLLGEKIVSGSGTGLTFEALREFADFNIIDTSETGSTLQYSANTHIKDYETNIIYAADIFIVYKLTYGTYAFVSVTGTYHIVAPANLM